MTIPVELDSLYKSALSLDAIAIAARIPADLLQDVIATDDPGLLDDQQWQTINAIVRTGRRTQPQRLVRSTYAGQETISCAIRLILSEQSGCMTATELAEKTGAPVKSVRSVVNRMRQDGLIARQPVESDRGSRVGFRWAI